MIHRIRRHLSRLRYLWDFKANCFDPVDWRPREWNRGADYLANHALTWRRDAEMLREHDMKAALKSYTALQFFSDGGYVEGVGGSIGVQLIAYGTNGRSMIGYVYKFVQNAASAFEMELLGLETALLLHAQLKCIFFCNLIKGAFS